MIRIKNWNSCIPEELRKTDFMAVYHFDSVIKIRRVVSPFIRGIVGPGSIGEAGIPRSSGAKDDEDEKEDQEPVPPPPPPPPPLTQEQKEALARVRRDEERARLASMVFPAGMPTAGSSTFSVAPNSIQPVASGSSTPLAVATPSSHLASYNPQAAVAPGHGGARYRTNPNSQVVPSPTPSLIGTPTTSYQQLPRQQQFSGVGSGASTPIQQQQRLPQQQYQQPSSQFANGRGLPPQVVRGPGGKPFLDRTVIGNSGGSQYVAQVASFDTVSEATGK